MATVLDMLRPPSLRDHALEWASRGFRVFPCIPGSKEPRVARFYEVATCDADEVHRLWTDEVTGWPLDHNIGVDTSDMIVVDIDQKNGKDGSASYAALNLPADTLTVRSPSGGRHAYLSGPSKSLSVGKIGEGLDVRSFHGYVLAPGSVLDPLIPSNKGIGGTYELVHDVPMVAAPERLIAMLDAPRERSSAAAATELDSDFALARAAKYLREEAPLAIEGDGGDDTTFRVAAIVKDMGLSEVATFDALAEHWNERCAPPWEFDELQRKVENAFAYALSPAGGQTPAVDFAGVGELPDPIYREGTLAARKGTRRQFKRLGDPSLIVGPEWLLKPWLPRSGVVLLAGQSQIGKSFLAIDLAGALANGSQWFGNTPRDIVGSLYVAAEGEQTIGGRLEAVRLTRLNGMAQASVPIFPDNLDDVERPDDPRVRVNELLEHFAHAIVSARDTMAEEGLPPLGVVFIDTLGDAFQVDDNDTSTVKALMSGLGKLARRLAILIVGITHFGKDDRAGVAGTYNWKAGADVVLAATGEVNEVAGTVKRRQLVLNKSRYVETGFISAFDLTVVDIGMDPDGTPAKAAAITATTAKAKAEKPSPHADLLVECLNLALVDHVIEVDGYQVAPRYEVMKWFRERKPGSKDSGNVSRAFAWAERWADVKLITRDGVEYMGEGRWPVFPA